MFVKNIQGKEGTIRIVELGAVIGQFASWRLSLEKKAGRDDEYEQHYTFQAECEYINPALFDDDDYKPQVFIVVQRDRRQRSVTQFRLEQEDGRSRRLEGRSLLMEGCHLVRSE